MFDFFKEQQKNYEKWFENCESFFEFKMPGVLEQPEELMKKWYDETFGKTLKMMNMGINLETQDEEQKALDAYNKMMFAAGKLSAIMAKCSSENNKTIIEKCKSVADIKELYELWYETNEKAMEELFATDEFSKAFADFNDKYFKYMAAYNAVVERSLSKLPIPTNKDMNALYWTVYNLRKDVRNLKKEVEVLKGEHDTDDRKC